jgi:hypothetical protein
LGVAVFVLLAEEGLKSEIVSRNILFTENAPIMGE